MLCKNKKRKRGDKEVQMEINTQMEVFRFAGHHTQKAEHWTLDILLLFIAMQLAVTDKKLHSRPVIW